MAIRRTKDQAPAEVQTPNGESTQYRENPKTNEKIDAWIANNPDRWEYFRNLPPDRAARKLVLNEVQGYERRQKMNNGILNKLKENPEALKAYEALVKHLPEDQRERAMISIARSAFRATAPRKGQGQEQQQQVSQGVGISA
ncbi:MAG TPA: hypothetical protein VGN61_13205 [Verrucomicrobiae bacterium]|jgi:hypothetical protein